MGHFSCVTTFITQSASKHRQTDWPSRRLILETFFSVVLLRKILNVGLFLEPDQAVGQKTGCVNTGEKGVALNSAYSSFLARLKHVNPQQGSSQGSDCVNVCVCKRWRPYVCKKHTTYICGKYRHRGASRKSGMRSSELAIPSSGPCWDM